MQHIFANHQSHIEKWNLLRLKIIEKWHFDTLNYIEKWKLFLNNQTSYKYRS